MENTSRGARAVRWIEEYCVVPNGSEKGQRVRLSEIQRKSVRQIYDEPQNSSEAVPLPLAAYLALLHVCGLEALQREFLPKIKAGHRWQSPARGRHPGAALMWSEPATHTPARLRGIL